MVKQLLLTAAIAASTVLGMSAKTTVLFEGPADIADDPYKSWYPGIEIPKASIIAAGEGAVLSFDVTFSGEGYSYKLSSEWTSKVVPSFADIEGYSEEWSTVYSTEPTISFTFTKEDIEFLATTGDSNLHISGAGNEGNMIVSNVTLTTPDGQEATTLDITSQFGGGGWQSSFDAATMTITYEGAWAGCGQWFGNDPGTDWSEWDQLVIEIEPVDFMTQIVVQYAPGEDADNETKQLSNGTAAIDLNADKKDNVFQYYLQSSEVGEIVLKKVYLAKKSEAGDDNKGEVVYLFNTDFEDGETNGFFSWNVPVEVNNGVLEITNDSEKNSWEAQFAFDFAEPLTPGTEYTLKMKAKGSVATSANVDAAFQFPDGDAGYPVCGSFGQINLTTEWKEISLTTTCEVKENWKATRLIFSLGKYVGTISIDEISLSYPKSGAVSTIEVDNSDAPVEFYNLQGVKVNIDNAANGIYIRRQGSEVKKVLIRK